MFQHLYSDERSIFLKMLSPFKVSSKLQQLYDNDSKLYFVVKNFLECFEWPMKNPPGLEFSNDNRFSIEWPKHILIIIFKETIIVFEFEKNRDTPTIYRFLSENYSQACNKVKSLFLEHAINLPS